MPGSTAENGDVYHVHRDATVDRDDIRDAHPIVCVAFSPHDPVAWKGLPRITTGAVAGDLPSPQRSSLPFTKDGYWTLRFARSVRKDLTGHDELCRFWVTLPEPERTAVLRLYRDRNRKPRLPSPPIEQT